MSHPREQEVAARLSCIIADGFNRAMMALEDAGAIDTRKMREHYKGIGSKYYDLVTEQIEYTTKVGAPWVCEIFPEQMSEDPGTMKKFPPFVR